MFHPVYLPDYLGDKVVTYFCKEGWAGRRVWGKGKCKTDEEIVYIYFLPVFLLFEIKKNHEDL